MNISLWQSLGNCVEAMARNALKDVKLLDKWKAMRPQRHKEFMQSVGLDPLPPRCDLKLANYGEFKGEGYRARRVAFQLLPDCWTTANIYYPDPIKEERAPGVVYVCGHADNGTYHFSPHGIMWAQRGYVCIVVDTIEQTDNPGEHHGFETGKQTEWLSLGYSASGGELWNAIRALDVLSADPAVDPERIGTTGVSGGGACSFFLGIADERIKAVGTLCGITTPVDAIKYRHVISHCDCMYYHNIHRKDSADYGALIAPRAVLFCFADDDLIFNPEETRALYERVRRIYSLMGCESNCDIFTRPGGHGDSPLSDEAVSKWFDRHLVGEQRPIVHRGEKVPEEITSVFNGKPPSPNRMYDLPNQLIITGSVGLPNSLKDWAEIRREAIAALPKFPAVDAHFEQTAHWRKESGATTAIRGQLDGVESWMYLSTRSQKPAKLIIGVCGAGEGCRDLMGNLGSGLDVDSAAVGFEPRLSALTFPGPVLADVDRMRWSIEKLLPFALPLVGQTNVMMTLADIRAAVDHLRGLPELSECQVFLYGAGEAGVAALYAGLTDEKIAGVVLSDAPASHRDGAPILGILRTMDMQQAVGLMAPRPVALVHQKHNYWTWPRRAYARLECPERFIMADSVHEALKAVMA